MVEKNRVEKIYCDKSNCKTMVADRRADGAIIRRVRHRGRWHVTIIMPREKLSLPGWKRGVEKIRCDETNCTIVVAERRADGTVIICDEHHGREHVTIIEPWPSSQSQDLDVGDIAKLSIEPDAANSP
jgi:hypothetical protein